jgi:histidinol-phosphate aminotransferase
MDLFKDHLERMEPYVPGEQPTGHTRVAKLNTNENPYPPSPRVAEAMESFDPALLRRYGDAMADVFRQAAGEALDIDAEWILPGNGSDDVIMMIARACLGPHRPVAYPSPTFGFYHTQGQAENAPIIEAPYDESLELPVSQLIDAQGAVTFIANPDSPTAAWADLDVLSELAQNVRGLLVIDEAYVDFAGSSAVGLLEAHENVILLRTLSKGYSLAGLRMGFGICKPPLLAQLLKVKQIYNVDSLAAVLGAAAISDQHYKNETCHRVSESRDRLREALLGLGWRVGASRTNFLLAGPPGGHARRIAETLKARGILVRYFAKGIVADKLRITVGTEQENQRLVAALKELG